MPEKPENQIEQLLRGYADQRRETAGRPLELHPATRQRLQEVVQRTFGQPRRGTPHGLNWLALLWPRLAVGLAIFAMLLTIVLLIPRGTERQLAMAPAADGEPFGDTGMKSTSESASPGGFDDSAASRADATSSPPPAAVPATSFHRQAEEDNSGRTPATFSLGGEFERAKLKEREMAELPAIPPDGLQAPVDRKLRMTRDEAVRDVKLAERVTPIPPTPPAPAEPAKDNQQLSLTLADSAVNATAAQTESRLQPDASLRGQTLSESGASGAVLAERRRVLAANEMALPAAPPRYAQNFSQLNDSRSFRQNFNSPPAPQVLNSFRLEQTGRTVRIIDGDGSIYLGEVQPPAGPQAAEEAPARKVKPAASISGSTATAGSGQPGQSQWIFRASGTNRTLNQLVIFEGSVIAADSQALQREPRFQSSRRAGQGADELAPPAATNLMIQGRATIGGHELPIQAEPVPEP